MRELFGDARRVARADPRGVRRAEPGDGPRDYVELFKETFGPVIALYAFLADQPERAAALDREFLEFATRANRGAPDGPAEYHYEYLLVVARKRRRVSLLRRRTSPPRAPRRGRGTPR